MKRKPESVYGIIGLGRFGFPLAKTLSEAGKEVLVVDCDQEKVRKATEFTDNAFVINSLTRESLQEVGFKNCDTVVVCIGEKIDTSILTTLTVINLGIKRVISKATTYEQGCVLEKLGAELVYPERDMAIRLANKLIKSKVMEYISLSDDIDISELLITEKVANISVFKLNLRAKFGLNIIAIKRGSDITTEIQPDFEFADKDIIVVVGKRSKIQKLEEYLEI
ncbi:MAG: TrkA family potassium uptake protein [Clostridiales bacterium]